MSEASLSKLKRDAQKEFWDRVQLEKMILQSNEVNQGWGGH